MSVLALFWLTSGAVAACLDTRAGWVRPTFGGLCLGLLLGPLALAMLVGVALWERRP